MWQQSGSSEIMASEDTKAYIARLNQERFAGYGDWRLPTLEEAMSLMAAKKMANNLYIDPVFDAKQEWIRTSDQFSASRAWSAGFLGGSCFNGVFGSSYYVRAVRFG